MIALLYILAAVTAVIAAALLCGWLYTRSVAGKVRRAHPPLGSMTTVTGGRIHSIEQGSGRDILMIHGLAGNALNFMHSCVEPLAEDFHVVAIDRPGNGYSERTSDDQARLPQQAKMIAEFIERTGLQRPLLVGHSMGGAVSLTLALNHPELVSGLALLAPLTSLPVDVPEVFRGLSVPSAKLRRLLAETVAVPVTVLSGAAAINTIFAPEPVPDDFAERGGGRLAARPEAFYAASTDMCLTAADLSVLPDRYSELKVPVGVLYGDQDHVLRHEHHIEALQRIQPEIDLEVLEGVGHMPLVTQPQAAEALIRRMADRCWT